MPHRIRALAVSSPLAAFLDGTQSGFANNFLLELLRDIPDALLLIDTQGRIVFHNAAASQLFGLAEATDLLPAFESILPENETVGLAELREQLESRSVLRNLEMQMRGADRRTLDVLVSLTAIRDAMGRMLGFSAVVLDVSSIKESEKRIARRTAQLFALNTIAEAVSELPGLQTLLDRVLDAVFRVTDVEAGCIHLVEDEDESLTLTAHRGLTEGARELMTRFEAGEGIIGRTSVLADALFVADTTNDRRLVHRNLSEEHIGALASIPLIAVDGVRGVLTLFHAAPHAFTPHEQGMLAAIGRQVGVALEHMRLFEDVTTARREWEQTFEAMTDGVSIHSTSGKIRRVNRALASLFGATPDALIGIRCCELYHGSKKPHPNCTIMRTVTERQGQRVELRDRGTGRVLRVTTDPVIGPNGRITGVVCTTRDITGEKLLENRLVQQERISAIGELAAGIAHEVGTPLNIISANVEYLLKQKKMEDGREELEAIREQSLGIAALIHQLLDFARDRAPEFAPVNLNQLIERTLGLLSHTFSRAEITVGHDLAPYVPTVDGDVTLLQQVLFNIIKNASQAMETDLDSTRELFIATDSAFLPTDEFASPHVVVTIRDSGPGIPVEDLPHVTKPFFTTKADGGTGLGLAISQKIIEQHHGRMTIENGPTHGALVTLRLPLSQDRQR